MDQETVQHIFQTWTFGPYFMFLNKVIRSAPEAKFDLEIFAELTGRLGANCLR